MTDRVLDGDSGCTGDDLVPIESPTPPFRVELIEAVSGHAERTVVVLSKLDESPAYRRYDNDSRTDEAETRVIHSTTDLVQ